MQNKLKFLLVLVLLLNGSSNLIAMSEVAALIAESGCFSAAALIECAELDKSDRIVLSRNLVSKLLKDESAATAKKIASKRAVADLLLNLSEDAIETYLAARRARIIAIEVGRIAEQARNNIHGRFTSKSEHKLAIVTSLAKSNDAARAHAVADVAEACWQLSVNTLPKRMASALLDYRFKLASNTVIQVQHVFGNHKTRPGRAERVEAYRDTVRAQRLAGISVVSAVDKR